MAEIFKLHARIGDCDYVKFTAPTGGINTGAYYALEDVVGIVLVKDGKAAGEKDDTCILLTRVPAPGITLPKTTTTGINTFAAGENVYWNVSEGACQNEDSGNVLIGVALEAAARLATTVVVALNGVDA